MRGGLEAEADRGNGSQNGATEPTKKTEKTTNGFFSDSSVFSVAPFLRSVASVTSAVSRLSPLRLDVVLEADAPGLLVNPMSA
jgi:hypothetical protein